MARAVAEPLGEALDAVALDDAVGDQPHRPAGGVRGQVPLGRPGGGAGQAPLAGAVAGGLRGGRGAVEGHVARLGVRAGQDGRQ